MALFKTIRTPKGQATYWIMGMIQIDNYSKTAYGRLYGFMDKEHCDEMGSVPILTLDYNIPPDIYPLYFKKEIMEQQGVTPQSQFYQIVKDRNYLDDQNKIINFNDATEVY